MAGQQLPDDLFAWLRDLERRLVALERSPQLTQTSIKDGALSILDASGVTRVKVGRDGSSYGVKVYDSSGANPVELSTLAFAQVAATVATAEMCSSAVFGDLATAGPAVTTTIGASGRAIVTLTAAMQVPGDSSVAADVAALMGFAVSGATTRAATDADALALETKLAINQFIVARPSVVLLAQGLTPGSTTFTAQYRVTDTVRKAAFQNRQLFVQPF